MASLAIVHLFDVSDPARPHRIGEGTSDTQPASPFPTGWYTHLVVADSTAYLGAKCGQQGRSCIQSFDISDPQQPQVVQTLEVDWPPLASLVIHSDRLYASVNVWDKFSGDKLHIYDRSNPTHPVKIGEISGIDQYLRADDQHIYVAHTYSHFGGPPRESSLWGVLSVFDAPKETVQQRGTSGRVHLPTPPNALVVVGHYVYIADRVGMVRAVDITDRTQPCINWLAAHPNPAVVGKLVLVGAPRSIAPGDDIGMIYPDGSGWVNLTGHYYTWGYDPAIAPDGQRVAYATGQRDVRLNVWDARTQEHRDLVASSEQRARHPTWSPDGRRIAFQSTRDDTHANDWDIWVIDADGANLTRLTDDPGLPFAPAWSPDGRQIAFHSYRDGNGNIYLMDTDGANQRRITDHPANDTDPAFSPDGEYIAFQSSRDTPDGCGMNVWVMQTDGSDPRNLTGHTDCAPRSGAPTWSPDGTMLAFQRQASRDGEMQIVVLELTRTGDTMQPGAVRILGPGSFPDWGP